MTRTLTFVALLALPLLAACNTFEGLGQDVQNGGENIEETAQEAK